MGTKQTIAAQDDRTFNTSIGNWTGNVTWGNTPLFGINTYAKIIRNSAADPDTMTLVYPHVYAIKKRTHDLSFIVHMAGGSFGIYSKWTLTDGVLEYSEEDHVPYVTPWFTQAGTIELPAGWIKENTQLKITIRPDTGYPIIGAYSFFDLTRFWTSTQFLPVLGIG